MLDLNDGAGRLARDAFDRVLKLDEIPRPGQRAHQSERRLREGLGRHPRGQTDVFEEPRRQQRHVADASARRRQIDADAGETAIKVGTEAMSVYVTVDPRRRARYDAERR